MGVSAVVLSLCGLFISLYEASLMRTEQRASVWPHVETATSIRSEEIRVWTENSGIGPARVRAAALLYDGELLHDWRALLEQMGVSGDSVTLYQSLINGRVLSPEAPETIFSVSQEGGPAAPRLMEALREAITGGELDLAVCYCSVYEECWMSRLQDVVVRFRGERIPDEARKVESCDGALRSGI